MGSCFDSILCCLKSGSSRRLFYQQDDSDERGIEYDRLIELPDQPVMTSSRGKAAPQLILNERERHLISNKLYEEYALDQSRFDRIAEDELKQEEESLALQEEEFYAEKNARIREFYANRPLTTAAATSSTTQDFADFSERFAQSPRATSHNVSDDSLPSNHVANSPGNVSSDHVSSDHVSMISPDSTKFEDAGEWDSTLIPESRVAVATQLDDVAGNSNTGHENPMPVEQSDKLLQDIDTLLAEGDQSSDEFLSDYVINDDQMIDDDDVIDDDNLGDSDIETVAMATDSAYNPYYLTNVSIDSSVAPEPPRELPISEPINETFDPFLDFEKNKVEKSSSHDSFVEISE